jgi:hypothetical protein
MAQFYTQLDEKLRQFILAQHMFFTATAPNQGRINLSPKGLDTFRIINDQQVAYLDLTGSGIETAAHVLENGRLTIMLCSFDHAPWILRIYGRGRAVRPQDAEWNELHAHFESLPGERQIIVLDIETIQTSCGFGVPQYEYVGQRDTLIQYACKQGPEKLAEYQRTKNVQSIDGVPSHYVPVNVG